MEIEKIEEIEKHSRLILVVEDDSEISDLVQTILERKIDCKIILAFNGADALEELARLAAGQNQAESSAGLPDLIITDLHMPIMDGASLCQELRSTPAYQDIPIIVLSAYQMDLPENLRIDRFISKPFRVAVLVDIVQEVLAAHSLG